MDSALLCDCIIVPPGSANGVLNRALSGGEVLKMASGSRGLREPRNFAHSTAHKWGIKSDPRLIGPASTDQNRGRQAILADPSPDQPQPQRRLPEVLWACGPPGRLRPLRRSTR